jgi:GNAT superfamily N-acetyltransferase
MSAMAADLSFIVRPLEPGDHARWLPLWDGYNAFYGRAGETALDPQITRATWGRFFEADEPVHALAAERDGALLGIAHYLFHRSTNTLQPVCYLQDLFTAPEARGQGVGRALIEAVCDRARAAGAPRVYWHTHESNATAIGLYETVAERSGFIVFRTSLPDASTGHGSV